MSEEPHHVVTLASLHAAQTQQAIALGRIEERLSSMQRGLDYHMQEEHKEFKEALDVVTEVRGDIRDIHQAGRVTRWIALAIAAIATTGLWMWDNVRFK